MQATLDPGYPVALALLARAWAAGIRPEPVVSPAAWAAEHLVVADGPQSGYRWDPTLTPYAIGILEALAAESPHNVVSVRKSAQTGLTELGIAWLGYIVDVVPAQTLVVFPTIDTGRQFARQKLGPAIEQTKCLARTVREVKSRSAAGSTSLSKQFPGGAITITGASSSSDLRSKTVRFVFADEIDDWPLDLAGQGDPMGMVDARMMAFHATASWKKLQGSTPTIKGASRIDAAWEAGDQRYWHVPCPHCGEFQVLEFGGRDVPHGLKFNTAWPYDAHYVCRHCGARIEEHQKAGMVRAGEWRATVCEPGREPSFHIDSLSSLLTTWDRVAETFLAARDDPTRLKVFWNTWLGLPWEERGEAPEWQRLYVRREDYPARTIPPGGVILTGAADVQQRGIYYEVVAWDGLTQESWSLDVGYLEGETADPTSRVWRDLAEVYEQRYPDSYGNAWAVDLFGVDAGFNSNAVYAWTRGRPKAMALKGVPGWTRAAIASSPTKQDLTERGRLIRRGAELWPVGTWSLKAQLYGWLRKEGRRDGAEADPPGFVHTSEAVHDEGWFQQLVAEYLAEREFRGRMVREWVARGPNHYHDCRIYNMALAARLGVGRMTEQDWRRWVSARCQPAEGQQGDLLALAKGPPPPAAGSESRVTAIALASGAEALTPTRPRTGGPRRGSGFVQGWR